MAHRNRRRAAEQHRRNLTARQRVPAEAPPKDTSTPAVKDAKPTRTRGGLLPTDILPIPTLIPPKLSTILSPPRPTLTPPVVPPVSSATPLSPSIPVLPSSLSSSILSSVVSLPSATSLSSISTSSVLPSTSALLPSTSELPSTTTTVIAAPSRAIASASTTPSNAPSSNSSNSAVLAGSVTGGLVGVAALSAVAVVLFRRYRAKAAERDAFNATSFRRSAILLDDPAPPSHGHSGSGSGGGSIGGGGSGVPGSNRPRPPTMIERHIANAPTLPAASYPYDTGAMPQYGQYAAIGAYNTGFNGDSYGGAYPQQQQQHPMYASYGAQQQDISASSAYGLPYGAYAAAQQQQQQQQPQRRPSGQDGVAPNPFSNASAASMAAVAAARAAAETSFVPRNSPSPPAQGGTASAYVSRQQQQPQAQAGAPSSAAAPPTTQPGANYADVQRDVKPPAATPAAADAGNKQRPTSTYTTIYDPDDAYGGM